MKKLLLAMVASMLLAGCTPRIEIAASKEPITINMNVKLSMRSISRSIRMWKTCSNPAAICSEATMRKRLLTAALTLALLSAPALALTLSEARQQGRVGRR